MTERRNYETRNTKSLPIEGGEQVHGKRVERLFPRNERGSISVDLEMKAYRKTGA